MTARTGFAPAGNEALEVRGPSQWVASMISGPPRREEYLLRREPHTSWGRRAADERHVGSVTMALSRTSMGRARSHRSAGRPRRRGSRPPTPAARDPTTRGCARAADVAHVLRQLPAHGCASRGHQPARLCALRQLGIEQGRQLAHRRRTRRIGDEDDDPLALRADLGAQLATAAATQPRSVASVHLRFVAAAPPTGAASGAAASSPRRRQPRRAARSGCWLGHLGGAGRALAPLRLGGRRSAHLHAPGRASTR